MKRAQASLETYPVKGTAARAELPELAPPALPLPDAGLVRAPPLAGGTVSLNLRIPPDLHRQLKVRAFEEGTSINTLLLDSARKLLEEP